jgi:hypothetical protein
MRSTPLPVRPYDVAVLTVPEFTCQLHSSETVSIDVGLPTLGIRRRSLSFSGGFRRWAWTRGSGAVTRVFPKS